MPNGRNPLTAAELTYLNTAAVKTTYAPHSTPDNYPPAVQPYKTLIFSGKTSIFYFKNYDAWNTFECAVFARKV